MYRFSFEECRASDTDQIEKYFYGKTVETACEIRDLSKSMIREIRALLRAADWPRRRDEANKASDGALLSDFWCAGPSERQACQHQGGLRDGAHGRRALLKRPPRVRVCARARR
jgi:hypothetical protein